MKYLSENGIKLLKNLEGLRLQAYQCSAGRWTIGYGHTGGVKAGDVITQAQAEVLLTADLVRFESAVNKLVKAPLNQNQFDALVIFCFNVGFGNDGFGGSTMLKLLNGRDYKGAAGQFTKWCYAAGAICEGLYNRRVKERDLFLKPV